MVQRKDIDGATEREKVFALLHSFDDRGMPAAEFESKAIRLLGVPGITTAAALLAHYRTRSTQLQMQPCALAKSDDSRAVADDCLINTFSFYGERHALSKDIDWTSNPGTWHWGHDLNRFGYLRVLSQAFHETGNRAYAQKAIGLILDWVAKNDVADAFPPDRVPYAFASYLNIAIHLEAWTEMLGSLLPAVPDLLSPLEFLRIAKSIHDQLWHLDFVIPEESSNWVTIGTRGQLATLAFFAEMAAARTLCETALLRLGETLRDQVLPDGVQNELTPHYHYCVVNNIDRVFSVEAQLPVPIPDGIRTLYRGMLSYLRQTLTPDGKHLSFNDSDPYCGSGVRALLANPLSRAVLGAEADDEMKSCLYPYAGVVFLREGSRFGSKELYLAFDGGPFGRSHQHEDKLSFWLSAYGRSLIVDPGRHLYDMSEVSFYPYLRSTKAHSTILIDGQGQNSAASPQTWVASQPVPVRYREEGDGSISAEAVYDLGYGPERIPVIHRRRITFHPGKRYWVVDDEVMGTGAHDVESRFQFCPGDVTIKGDFARTHFPEANLLIGFSAGDWTAIRVEKGETAPRAGWYSDGYNLIEPAPALVLQAAKKALPFRTRIWLCPFPGNEPPTGVRDLWKKIRESP